MKVPPTPADEAQRLAALRGLALLDTAPEERFDRLTRLARRLFDVPMAIVSLVDADRQWFKSRDGLEAQETPRDVSFCGHAVLGTEVMVVPDATLDDRFHDNPFVTGALSVRFYAGYPLATADGSRVGTLCVIDSKPRELSEEDLGMLRDLGRMVEEQLTVERQATVDELTGLSNRRGFLAFADRLLDVCRRHAHAATLCFLDLNGFKQINDTLGHAAGDAALVEFARALQQILRGSDVVGRLGGDEFCLLLVGADAVGARAPIERLRQILDARKLSQNLEFNLRFSIGIVQFDPARHLSIQDLMDEADAAMYAEKRLR